MRVEVVILSYKHKNVYKDKILEEKFSSRLLNLNMKLVVVRLIYMSFKGSQNTV